MAVPSAVPIAIGALGAAKTAFQTVSQAQSLKAQAKQDKINARIAETRGDQISAQRREELDRSIGAITAARATGVGGPLTPTAIALIEEANTNISTGRLRDVATERQRAADFRASAKNKRQGARFSILTGAFSSGVSLGQGIAGAVT